MPEDPDFSFFEDQAGVGLSFTDGRHFRFDNGARGAVAWLRDSVPTVHEPTMSCLICAYMERHPRSIFFDVGALYGYFGLLAMAASAGQGSVFCFEMNPVYANALQKNIAANPHFKTQHITLIRGALSDVDWAKRRTKYKGFILEYAGEGAR